METGIAEGGAVAEPTALLRMTRTFGTPQRNFGSRRAYQVGFAKVCGRECAESFDLNHRQAQK